MTRSHKFAPFRKVLVPVIYGCDPQLAVSAARLIASGERITLAGIVGVDPNDSLSTGAIPAREIRRSIRALANSHSARIRTRVRVSHSPWQELATLIEEEHPDLMVLELPCSLDALHVTSDFVMGRPPCDIALVRGPLDASTLNNILVPLRGGPYAALALRLSLAISGFSRANVTSLHMRPVLPDTEPDRQFRLDELDEAFRGLARVLDSLPDVTQRQMDTADPGGAIISSSRDFDLIVMGASAQPVDADVSLGQVADRVLDDSRPGVIVVKTRQPLLAEPGDEMAGRSAISILVDKWFAENTYHADEFADLARLVELKTQQKLTISLALPALNEEATVGKVIGTIKQALVENALLLDEIVLIDSDSTDRTREIAANLGVPVHIHQKTLPQYGARRGKGEALWKSLYLTRGDIVIWIDTDIVNIHPRFVYGLIGPLLASPRIQFIKGFYRRPLRVGDKMQAGGGGRVTELTARPLLNLFYPELSGVVQPLSGEYGGRRSALEQLSFFSGYGVETGLLIDTFEMFGLTALAQVDLRERIHHNQPLEALSKMSFAIIQAVIRKLERRYGRAILEDVNRTMKLIRYGDERFYLDVEEIAEIERPPMISLREYQDRESQV